MWLVKEIDLLGVAVSGKACLALTPLRSSDLEFNSGGMLPIVSGVNSKSLGWCWFVLTLECVVDLGAPPEPLETPPTNSLRCDFVSLLAPMISHARDVLDFGGAKQDNP